MAIIVPSKKLYDTQSPQILKNAVKGISIDLLKDTRVDSQNNNNAYDYVISKENITSSGVNKFEDTIKGKTDPEVIKYILGFMSAFQYTNTQVLGSVSIPRQGDDYYIDEINPYLDLEIEFSTAKGTCYVERTVYQQRLNFYAPQDDTLSDVSTQNIKNYQNISNFTSSSMDGMPDNTVATINTTLSAKQSSTYGLTNLIIDHLLDVSSLDADGNPIYINKSLRQTVPIRHSLSATKNPDNIVFEFAFCEYFYLAYNSVCFWYKDHHNDDEVCPVIYFTVKKATIVLNETIRKIDRSKETVSVANVDSEGKPEPRGVQLSVGDNQFIKSGTTYDGQDAYVQLWGDVAHQYDGGKPYVRFVCSVGEYYDNEGNKVISTDTSDKMGFDIYDQVVVMKSGKHNADESIMLDGNGESKIYSVVSVKTYFDGALWQEVVAIDTRKTVDLRKTTYTTFINKAGGFTYKITSNQIRTEQNSAQGTTYIIGE